MQHPNAVLTSAGRLRLVELVEVQGMTFRAAAAALKVSVSTVHGWVQRWRAAGRPSGRAWPVWPTGRAAPTASRP